MSDIEKGSFLRLIEGEKKDKVPRSPLVGKCMRAVARMLAKENNVVSTLPVELEEDITNLVMCFQQANDVIDSEQNSKSTKYIYQLQYNEALESFEEKYPACAESIQIIIESSDAEDESIVANDNNETIENGYDWEHDEIYTSVKQMLYESQGKIPRKDVTNAIKMMIGSFYNILVIKFEIEEHQRNELVGTAEYENIKGEYFRMQNRYNEIVLSFTKTFEDMGKRIVDYIEVEVKKLL